MRQLCFLACCLAACGDDGVRHTPDAAPHHDGAPDIDAPVDGPLAPVTVTATMGSTPQAGVYVYFQNADDSVVLATRTDASGTATAVMAAGGSVTVLDPYGTSGSNREVYSFLSVKPGDNLVLKGNTAIAEPLTMTVTAPIDSTPGVQSYEVQSPCGGINLQTAGSGSQPTGQVTLNACGATTDFVILSRDSNFQIVSYIYAHDVPTTQGTLDLTASAYTAGSTRTYTVTNIPAGFTPNSFIDAVATAPNMYVLQSGQLPGDGSPTPITTVGFGTHASQIAIAGAHVGQHYFQDWGPYTDTYTTDAGARLLPDFSAAPTIDQPTHQIRLQEDAGGAAPDATYAVVFVSRPSLDAAWRWYVAAPHATAITLPTVPTDQFDPNIQAQDFTGVDQIVLLKVPGGYDALRPYMLTNYGSIDYTVSTAGQATTETLLAGFQRSRR